MSIRAKIGIVFLVLVCAGVLFCWHKTRPQVLVESKGIRIVATPSSWDNAIFCNNYQPRYRFEYREGDYLWAAASFFGDSFTARSADIKWISDMGAIVYLDEMACFKFDGRERIWTKIGSENTTSR